MITHEIPTQQWKPFLESFMHLHRGDEVNVERIGGADKPPARLYAQPLIGIVANPDGEEGSCIEVLAGSDEQVHAHSVRYPSHLMVTELDDGFPVAIQIAADDGSVTQVRIERHERSQIPPEAYWG